MFIHLKKSVWIFKVYTQGLYLLISFFLNHRYRTYYMIIQNCFSFHSDSLHLLPKICCMYKRQEKKKTKTLCHSLFRRQMNACPVSDLLLSTSFQLPFEVELYWVQHLMMLVTPYYLLRLGGKSRDWRFLFVRLVSTLTKIVWLALECSFGGRCKILLSMFLMLV